MATVFRARAKESLAAESQNPSQDNKTQSLARDRTGRPGTAISVNDPAGDSSRRLTPLGTGSLKQG